MSDVLTVIEPARDGGKPLLFVRCAGCRREYRVRCDKAQARKLGQCQRCKGWGREKLMMELRSLHLEFDKLEAALRGDGDGE